MAPGLNIPLKMPTEEFERAAEKARSLSTTAGRQIAQQFISANKEILASTIATTGAMTAQWVGLSVKSAAVSLAMKGAWIAAAMGIASSVGALVNVVREQMQQMIDIADKAEKAGVSAQFFQAFTAGARNAKIEATELADALAVAYGKIKPVVDPDWSAWDGGLKKIDDIQKALESIYLVSVFSKTDKAQGLDLFRNAGDNEARIKAVLVAMMELDAIGERLIALDLAEKMFGAKFAENVRLGNTSAQELLGSLEKLGGAGAGSGVWSDKLVGDMREVDRALKSAHETLDRNMAPQWAALAETANDIKSVWAEIIGVLARGAEIMNELDPVMWSSRLRAWARGETQESLEQRIRDERRANDLAAQAGLGDVSSGREVNRLGPIAGLDDIRGAPRDIMGAVPQPRRRPSDAPTPPKEQTVAETEDAFDKATNAINRQIAALQADAAAVGMSQSAHQQLRVELRLLEAARQSGTDITDKQIEAYAKLRTEMGAQQALAAAGIKLGADDAEQFVQAVGVDRPGNGSAGSEAPRLPRRQ
jgi:hypothetical protein